MSDRTCRDCGADISGMHHAAGFCGECRVARMGAVGLEPLVPYPGSAKPWPCRCLTCGSKASPTWNNIQRGQGGCVTCAGNAKNEAAAVAVMRSAHLTPLVPYPGRSHPWPSRCDRCGREVAPRLRHVKEGGGCRYCNDTAIPPRTASALMAAALLEPLEPYPGANRPWRCRCVQCGREVTPCYSSVERGWGGCRWCRNSGFKAADSAVVYLLEHPGFGALKIGIADTSGTRLRKHAQTGWRTAASLAVPGAVALRVEAAILRWWRNDLGLPPYLGREEMPQGGWTETVAATAVRTPEVVSRMRHLAA